MLTRFGNARGNVDEGKDGGGRRDCLGIGLGRIKNDISVCFLCEEDLTITLMAHRISRHFLMNALCMEK